MSKNQTQVQVVDQNLIANLQKAVDLGLSVKNANHITRAFTRSVAIQQLRSALTDDVIKAFVLPGMNTKTGFKTDRDPDRNKKCASPYPISVVRDCVIEALMNEVYIDGNQFNIIAGQCYITREGFSQKLSDIEGLWYDIIPAVPVTKNGGAIVEVEIHYSRNGGDIKKIKRAIPVKTDSYTSIDAILGKADRKAKCALYNHLTGQFLSDGDADDVTEVKYQEVKEPAKSVFEKSAEKPVQEKKAPAENHPVEKKVSKRDAFIADLKIVNINQVEMWAGYKGIDIENVYNMKPDYVTNQVLDWIDSQEGGE